MLLKLTRLTRGRLYGIICKELFHHNSLFINFVMYAFLNENDNALLLILYFFTNNDWISCGMKLSTIQLMMMFFLLTPPGSFYSLGWLVINGFLCIILIKLKLNAILEKLDRYTYDLNKWCNHMKSRPTFTKVRFSSNCRWRERNFEKKMLIVKLPTFKSFLHH